MDLKTSRRFLISIVMYAMFVCKSSSLSELQHVDMSRTKRSMQGSNNVFFLNPQYPRDCKEVYDQCEEHSADGIYLIKPEGSPEPFEVCCNNSIDGGGWTVLQRRVDGSVDFYRKWTEYKEGFGFLRNEFWLGNDKISYLTNQKDYELRIDLNNVNGEPYFAKYDLFRISDEFSKYRLVGLGEYNQSSTAGSDAMVDNRNQSFTTYDVDNDGNSHHNTAMYDHGAWWFARYGGFCRLNGLYNAGSTDHKSIYWDSLPGGEWHIKYTEMKVRPV